MKRFLLCIITLVLSLGCFSGCKPKQGEFISMQAAYEAGLLTREDVMEICYQWYGKVYSCADPKASTSEWVQLDYTSTKTVPELDKRIEKSIKYTFYKTHEAGFDDEKEAQNLRMGYFGEYNGLYAVAFEVDFYDCTSYRAHADDIVWDEYHDCGYLFRFI